MIDKEQKLKELKDLHDKKLINDYIFTQKQSEILDSKYVEKEDVYLPPNFNTKTGSPTYTPLKPASLFATKEDVDVNSCLGDGSELDPNRIDCSAFSRPDWNGRAWALWTVLTLVVVIAQVVFLILAGGYVFELIHDWNELPFFQVGSRAKGIIAIGQFSIGFISIGQFATGFITIGQFGVGFVNLSLIGIGAIFSVGLFSGTCGFGAGLGVIGTFSFAGGSLSLLQCRKGVGFHSIYPFFDKGMKSFITKGR